MTLYQAIAPEGTSRFSSRDILAVVAGSLLLTLSAKIPVPFYPVPMTMQTLVVIGLGLALGPV
ncbi:MAG: biotin transporter BioY, partial [Pseudaminobacter sp.]